MKKRSSLLLAFIFLLVSLYVVGDFSLEGTESGLQFISDEPLLSRDDVVDEDMFTVGMWNLHIFGQKKAADVELVAEYIDIILDHDIFVIQEIRNKDGTAFMVLCDVLREEGYQCINSSRAGRSNSKEQYGIFYKNEIILGEVLDYTSTHQADYERPPFVLTFVVENTSFQLATIHTKPDEVDSEMNALSELFTNATRMIIIGDLNADCSYYTPGEDFIDWSWIVHNDADTTVGQTHCAYDRILLSPDFSFAYGGKYGIITDAITLKESDHYPIWFELDL